MTCVMSGLYCKQEGNESGNESDGPDTANRFNIDYASKVRPFKDSLESTKVKISSKRLNSRR